MAWRRDLRDHALNLLVYAPVGLAVTAAEDLPELVERGRRRVTTQVTMARMVGQVAVAQGQRQAAHLVQDAARHLWASPPPAARQDGPGGPSPAAHAPTRRPANPPPQPPRPGGPGSLAPRSSPEGPAARTGLPPAAGGLAAADLAIPGYDALSASQVIQRLPSLSVSELAAVQAYESEHRRRRTVLNRVAQLQAGPPR